MSIEPDGAVYPCCVKTKLPIGSLLEDNLIDILDSLAGVPAYEAITMGHPERMGLAHGWSEATFIARSRTTTPDGTPYQNLCIGCDRFHEEVLGPVLEAARRRGRPRGEARARRRRAVVVPIVARRCTVMTIEMAALGRRRAGASLRRRGRADDRLDATSSRKARGQTVNFNAWAGDEKTNAFIAWVGEEVDRSATA